MGAYQFVLVAAGGTAFEQDVLAEIRRQLEVRVGELGLDPTEVAFFDSSNASSLDERTPAVAAYVSDTLDPSDSAAVDMLIGKGLLILPVVSALRSFGRLVPKVLRPINGIEPPTGDARYEALAGLVVGRMLEELRLLRRGRRTFISYKRVEASGVAEQLHEGLERRRYEVFLDTFSVDYGIDFQSVLWDTLGNCDVVILLRTKTAFASSWVEQEISRANASGIAVVQFVWPDVQKTLDGTEFADTTYLADTDFEGGSAGSGGGWTQVALTKLLTRIESVRARAHTARRARVLAELRQTATRAGVNLHLETDGVVRLERAASPARAAHTERLLPIVGYPDAVVLQNGWPQGKAAGALLYDGLGLLDEKVRHLSWLNTHLPSKSVAVQELEQWLRTNII